MPLTFLEEAEHILVIEERVKGYKVKVQYQPVKEGRRKTSKRRLPNLFSRA